MSIIVWVISCDVKTLFNHHDLYKCIGTYAVMLIWVDLSKEEYMFENNNWLGGKAYIHCHLRQARKNLVRQLPVYQGVKFIHNLLL